MKISKREKVLLVVLLLVIIAFVYYMFFMKKHQEELTQLKQDRQVEQDISDSINRRIIAAQDLDNEIKEAKKELKRLSKDKYSSLVQENQVVLIKRLTRDTNFKIKAMNFTERHSTLEELMPSYGEINPDQNTENQLESTEAEQTEQQLQNTGDYLIDALDVSLSFEGDYEAVDAYLKKIQNYDKKIVVSELDFSANSGENSSGTMIIHFYGIRGIDSLLKNKEKSYFKSTYRRKDPKTAYIPYPSYVVLNTVATEPSPEIDFGVEDVVIDEEAEEITKTVRLDSFEKYDVFFLGSSPDVYGKARLSSKASDRANSLKIDFDFFNPAVKNRANLVFDKNKKIIYEKLSSINLDAYLDTNFGENKLGFTIMDSTGNQKDYYFEINDKKAEWLNLSASVDGELKYPIMLKSIFVEGDGIYQSVKGELFIDNLSYVAE